jgi:hypothetical protein
MKIKIKNNPVILLVVGASLLALPRTSSADGHPPITKNGMVCQAASACIGEDGCSWISNQYDYWFAMGDCGTVGATSSDVCIMPWTQCRIHIQYYVPGCQGPSITIETWQYGCNGVGKHESEETN